MLLSKLQSTFQVLELRAEGVILTLQPPSLTSKDLSSFGGAISREEALTQVIYRGHDPGTIALMETERTDASFISTIPYSW